MKKNLFMTGALLATLAMAATGCSNENLTTDNSIGTDKKGGIAIITASTPQEAPSTRLAYEHLTQGGLDVKWEAQSSSHTEIFNALAFGDFYSVNYKLTQVDNAPKASLNSFKTMCYKSDAWTDCPISTDEEMHALYPIKSEYESVFQQGIADISTISANLPLNGQTGKLSDMKDFDYMTAVGVVIEKPGEEGGTALNLSFKHRVAVLCLKGLVFDGVTDNVTSFSFGGKGVKPSAKLTIVKRIMTDAIAFTDIDDATISTTGSTFAIASGTQSENAYICFFPNAEMNGKEMTVSATVGSDTYTCKFTVPAEGFLEGNMYTLSGKAMTKATNPSSTTYNYTLAEQSTEAGTMPLLENIGDANSADNPYLITTPEELQWVKMNPTQTNYYKLTKDIELNAQPGDVANWKPIGDSQKNFCGHFDGNNKKITGKIIASATDFQFFGFFGFTQNADIKNLHFEGDMDVSALSVANYRVGTIVGQAQSTNITNCSNKADLTNTNAGNRIGGIAGTCSGTISACINYGNISGQAGVSGIADSGEVTGCINKGNMDTSGGTNISVGGIMATGAPVACWSTATAITHQNSGSRVGAIVGWAMESTGKNCYWKEIAGLSKGCGSGSATDYASFSGSTPTEAQITAMNAAWEEADANRQYQFNATTGEIEAKL